MGIPILAGYWHTCVFNSIKDIYCWGLNHSGHTDVPKLLLSRSMPGVGFELDEDEGLSTRMNMTSYSQEWEFICASFGHKCEITSDRILYLWCVMQFNQAGVPIYLIRPTVSESAGNLHTCAIKNNDKCRCWGNDTLRQVEGNDVIELNCVIIIAAGFMHSCLIEDVRELMRG